MKQLLLAIIVVWGFTFNGYAQEENGFDINGSDVPSKVVQDSAYSFQIPMKYEGDSTLNTKIQLIYRVDGGPPRFDMKHTKQNQPFLMGPGDRDTIMVDSFLFSSAKVDKGVNVVEIWPSNPDTVILGDTASKSIEVVDSLTSIINHKAIKGVKLYPNPTSGELKLKNEQWEFQQVIIFNDQGKRVKSFSTPTQPIMVGELPKGLYILKARLASHSSEQSIITKKIILRK